MGSLSRSLPGASAALAAVLVAGVAASAAAAQSGDMPPANVITLTDTLPGAVGGLTVDRAGNIYVADFGDRIWKVTMTGEVSVLTEGMYGSSGNAIDSKGRILQSNFHGDFVALVERDGRYEVLAEGLQGPVGIAMGSADTAYVTNCRSNSISRVSPTGAVETFSEGELFSCPNGITRDPEGNFYVVNFSDSRMIKITPSGEAEEFAFIPGNGNGHVTYAAEMLYVTGFRSNQVYSVTLDGEVAPLAGTGRFSATDGPADEATFASPNGIAANPQGTALYTNDYLTPFTQRGSVAPNSIVRKIELPGLTAHVLTALDHGGVESAAVAYDTYRRRHPSFTAVEINTLGYELLSGGRTEAAVAVFDWNARDYPTQWWIWDSLGDGHVAAGAAEQAIAAYERSLDLNPENQNAIAQLSDLDP